MRGVFDFLFDAAGFMPHGFCLSWNPAVLYTHLFSDILIGLSYLSVALTLFVFTRRRRDLEFPWLFIAFTMVFGLCGISHLSEILTLWVPAYGLQGVYKATTGLVSLVTAALGWVLLPKALALASPEQLRVANQQLEREAEGHRQTERKLIQAKELAERASAAKSNFLATMSHELRTPLNAILGFSEVLGQGTFGALSAKQAEYVEYIHRSGGHLLQLISDLLDVSKIDVGQLRLVRGRVDVGALVRGCLELVAERAEKRGVALGADLPADLPAIEADELRLKQILLNLLSNALKFTSEGGRVTVRAGMAAEGRLEIAVADTGIGIAPEDIPRALEMFARVDNAMTRTYDGAGIGLPLSRTLAELHGGALDVASALGRGTTVTVRLPVHAGAAA